MKRLAVIALIIGLAAPSLAIGADVHIGLSGHSVAMGHVNELIETFEVDAGVALSPLRVAAGIEATAPVFSLGRIGTLAAGARYLMARTASRDASAAASLLGLLVRAQFGFGNWTATLDVIGSRGTFSFAEARFVGLSGLGAGLGGSISYRLGLTDRLGITAGVAAQWMAFNEMRDSGGQKYRGRGTPFVDFSGISASIGLTWSLPERRDG
jgi:hypothetical protein